MGGYGEQLTQPETVAFHGQLGKEVGTKPVGSAAAVDEMDNAISYDNPEARAGRHDVMEAAGVPLEPRQAAMTADKMNATDPADGRPIRVGAEDAAFPYRTPTPPRTQSLSPHTKTERSGRRPAIGDRAVTFPRR